MARSIYCSVCKLEKGPNRENESCCKECKSKRNKEKRAAKRVELGMRPYASGRKPECSKCNEIKENINYGYCNKCNREKDNAWRLETGRTKKHQTGLCPCGAERALSNTAYCQPCATEQSKQWRKINGFTLKEIKRSNELQNQRYVSVSKGRIRKKGTLVNGIAVNCKECDSLSEGWCEKCDEQYKRKVEMYHEDEVFKFKSQVRALTRSYIRAGVLVEQPCEDCGEKEVQAHHDDYNKPMDIRWLCVVCHNEHRKNEKQSNK
jgi:hypothetical protein